MRLDLSGFSSLATLLLVSVVSCGGGDGGGGDDGGDDGGDEVSAVCMEATEHSDLEWIQDEIFTVNCAAFVSCHSGDANLARGLNLEAGNSEAALVGVPAQGELAEGLRLVEPGQPDQSYLLVMLGQFGEDDPRIPRDAAGDPITMPQDSPLLCQEKRDAIERWISGL
jgi:hypothetical protein